MSLALTSRRAVLAPGPWVRDPLWRRARAVPTLDLRFADNKSLTDAVTGANLVTFTRASSGTFVDSAGVLQTAATDVPRFDHNPTTGESLGLLVEEARTNSIRNNTMVGAMAGTPGTLPTNWALSGAAGLTSTVAGVGTLNGISYIDVQLVGTSSGTFTAIPFEPATQVAATNAQAWTISSYLSVVAGSVAGLSVGFAINQFNSGGSLLAQLAGPDIASSLNSSLARFSFVSTTNQATVAFVRPFLSLNYASGVAINITLRIGLPQLEQGAFATSVIPTSTAAVTRSADVASITGSAFSSWYRQDEGTVFSEGGFAAAPFVGGNRFAGLYAINDGTSNNYIGDGLRVLPSFSLRDFGPDIFAGAVSQLGQDSNNIAENTSARCVLAYKVNDCSSAFSVGPEQSTDTSATIPTVTQMQLGVGRGNAVVNGHIKRLAYFPTRLPNSTLQSVTQ